MTLDRLPEVKKWHGPITTRGSGIALSGYSDLVVVENTKLSRLTRVTLAGPRASRFIAFVRTQAGANPSAMLDWDLAARGMIIDQTTFSDPILEWRANAELCIQQIASAAAGETFTANLQHYELRG